MSAKTEFRKYLAWIQDQNVSADGKRVAAIVWQAFDRIASTSANASQRSRVLAPLLEERLVGEDIPLSADAGTQPAPQAWTQLRSLGVGPFRGFRQMETFDLHRPIVLIYGPNGTGKSSLCEALEFALLGSVDDAAAKRIPEEDYLKNVHAKRFDPPVLMANGTDGKEVRVAADRESHRFCFIEKNRIDAFSRMGARPPAQRLEIIATLFGMEDFVDFVRNFNADISSVLTLVDRKNQELEGKRKALAGDQATVKRESADRAALTERKTALAQGFQDGMTYEALLKLLGFANAPGRLQELQTALDAVPPAETGLEPDKLDVLRETAQAAHDRHVALGLQLGQRRSDVNFKSLYEALQGLEPEGLDICPACTTPLTGTAAVRENPFDRARKGLADLRELGTLQDQHGTADTAASGASDALQAYLRRIAAVVLGTPAEAPVMTTLRRLKDSDLKGPWWAQFDACDDTAEEHQPAPSVWEIARRAAQRAKESDTATKALLSKRNQDIVERDRLLAVHRQVDEIALLERQLADTLAAAQARIASFNATNAKLIADVQTERAKINSHMRLRIAYEAFLASLQSYRDDLPRAITADLSATALAFYNAFNRNDHDADQLAKLVLPGSDDERIRVAFNSHAGDLQDALQVMSEGHIRCLGLAILVAKNVMLKCPVLIFDDPVNAIDDEHRGSIRDTLFDEAMLGPKQVILMCHGEELIKDIQTFIGAKRAEKDCRSYTLLPHSGDRLIRVDHGESRNYVVTARQNFNNGRIRDALGESRRATEALCMRTWRFLAKQGHGELRLKMERLRQTPESHDLATQIKGQIESKNYHHPDKVQLVACFQQMLDRWKLLNPGTHEEDSRTDFPRHEVESLIKHLETLDGVLTGKANK